MVLFEPKWAYFKAFYRKSQGWYLYPLPQGIGYAPHIRPASASHEKLADIKIFFLSKIFLPDFQDFFLPEILATDFRDSLFDIL